MEKTISEMSFIGELPGPGPWEMRAFGDMTLCVSPNHIPHVIQDGKLWPLLFTDDIEGWTGRAITLDLEFIRASPA